MYVYPQLPAHEASELLADLARYSPSELAEQASTSTESAQFYSLGIDRVTSQKLKEVRRRVVGIAEHHGFPTVRSSRASAFDSDLTRTIVESMEIVPSDAMEEGVWSFLTLRVLPDVAAWRYPFKMTADGHADSSYERLIGRPRNVFRKLWMRSYIFGPELGARLGEDNWEGFYGRATLGGNPRIARMIAEEFFRRADLAEAAGQRVKYQESLRDALKRILRLSGLVSLHAMPNPMAQELIEEAFDQTFLAASSSSVPLGAAQ